MATELHDGPKGPLIGLLVEPATSGSRVTLSLRFDGLLGGLMGRVTRDTNHRYRAMEASGLKARCENI